MFDVLPATRAQRHPGRGIALTAAVIVHGVIGVALGVASLLAAEPIAPPSIAVVFRSGGLPSAPPALPAAAAPRRRETAASRPGSLATRQPRTNSDSAAVTAAASSTETGSATSSATTPGTPDGVPGGFSDIASPSEPALDPAEPLPVGGNVLAPVVITQVQPRYPELAKRMGVQGLVVLEAVINTEGRIEAVKILRGQPLLDEAAIEAVQHWRFRPGTLNGRPVTVYFTLTVNFILR